MHGLKSQLNHLSLINFFTALITSAVFISKAFGPVPKVPASAQAADLHYKIKKGESPRLGDSPFYVQFIIAVPVAS